MDLFEAHRQQQANKNGPLAIRMRPRSLEEIVGQQEIIGPGRLLRRMIEADRLCPAIFWGPPGTGKTSLAQVIANATRSYFQKLNAITAGVGDIRTVIHEAKERAGMYNRRTILFVDEIHRFNKTQQESLLAAVEEGILVLIGATTQNPYFEISEALLSRSRIFRLQRLSLEDIRLLLQRALADQERGLGRDAAEIDPEAMEHLINVAGGDARTALNALELAVMDTEQGPDGIRRVTRQTAEEAVQERMVRYEKTGDYHYDVISAFIKSIRGSDPDAAIHWLARMISAGEDPRFIARRMVILAAEDIGLADPHALVIAVAAAQALELVGMPEARLNLAEAALYLARSPKSNSVTMSIDKAMHEIKTGEIGTVPAHLRDNSYPGAKQLGHGKGYLYPHDYPGHYVEQQYLPDALAGAQYFIPSGVGADKQTGTVPPPKAQEQL